MSNITDKNIKSNNSEFMSKEKQIEEMAKHYIDRIFVEISRFERKGEIEKPTIIMSRDVFQILQASCVCERNLFVNHEYQTICGCKVDIVSGTQKLYVGLNLI